MKLRSLVGLIFVVSAACGSHVDRAVLESTNGALASNSRATNAAPATATAAAPAAGTAS